MCCSTALLFVLMPSLLLLLLLSTVAHCQQAPVNVNAAGVEDEVVSHMIDCPPHLIGLLIGRGGSTIKRIKEESRANVVINQKMMKVCVCILYILCIHAYCILYCGYYGIAVYAYMHVLFSQYITVCSSYACILQVL
jgi:KH domain